MLLFVGCFVTFLNVHLVPRKISLDIKRRLWPGLPDDRHQRPANCRKTSYMGFSSKLASAPIMSKDSCFIKRDLGGPLEPDGAFNRNVDAYVGRAP